jgi:Cdc6-like AAA superfamily ATPase
MPPIPNEQRFGMRFRVGELFTPATPINEKDLFAGRLSQVNRVIDAVSQRGQHAILYGERGVGKTSLSNVLSGFLEGAGKAVLAPRVSVATSDSYAELWRRIFSQLRISRQVETIGLRPELETYISTFEEELPQSITPDSVRVLLEQVGKQFLLILIVDEFDRLVNEADARLFADTIKTLSDYAIPATIVLVGVADSVDRLIHGHESVLRNLVQIPMPRMPANELRAIVTNRLPKLGMSIAEPALEKITILSRGLPHYTHLIGQHAALAAIEQGESDISESHVKIAMDKAIQNAQQTLQSEYHTATVSPQKGNLYAEVLLACALSQADEFGYFAPADLRSPLQSITGRDYDIPNFARHLSAFTSQTRGGILQSKGDKYQRRFRFGNPLMQPYVIMRGIAGGLISLDDIERYS